MHRVFLHEANVGMYLVYNDLTGIQNVLNIQERNFKIKWKRHLAPGFVRKDINV